MTVEAKYEDKNRARRAESSTYMEFDKVRVEEGAA